MSQCLPGELATRLIQVASGLATYASDYLILGRSDAGVAPLAGVGEAMEEVRKREEVFPMLWKGTPVATGPIAEAAKWLAWNAAWHAANEQSGFTSDARRALASFEQYASKLEKRLPHRVAKPVRLLAWEASWRAAHERKG